MIETRIPPHKRHQLDFPADEGRTKQEFVDECDITKMIANATRGGLLRTAAIPPSYGDFTNNDDYQMSLNKIIDAQQAFDDLPSKIRERFNQDPGKLIDFMNDSDNQKEAEDLGLVAPPEVPETPTPEAEPPPSPAVAETPPDS